MSHARTFTLAVAVLASASAVVLAWPDGDTKPGVTPTKSLGRATPHQVIFSAPPEAPTVATDAVDRHGKPIRVNCSSCHGTRPADRTTRRSDDLDTFHQGLTIRHGAINCLSCHHQDDYDSLRRADGSAISFGNVRDLCAQCHGPQRRDYDAGAHGGMRGHWDLNAGPRYRNTCTDCHDPHAPAYPKVMPVFPPAKDTRHG